MKKLHDVLILGATPAGYAAGAYLGGLGCDVVVVDTPPHMRSERGGGLDCPLIDWAPSDVFQPGEGKIPSGLPESLAQDANAEAFTHVKYHDAAMARTAEFSVPDRAGYFVSPAKLTVAMRNAAVAAGVTVRAGRRLAKIRLHEDHVDVVTSRPIHARLLIVAHDSSEAILAELGRPARENAHLMTAVGLDVPLGASGKKKRIAEAMSELRNALHIVELPERSELGLFFVAGQTLHLRVVSTSSAAGNRSAELSTMIHTLQQGKILPADLDLRQAKGAVWYPPAGGALEQETHEAKRCLLAGSAGGFAESVTGQTLCPSVRSTLLAAATAHKALASDDPQETIMTFNATWRENLADYLRPPNTSLAMLLPLLFVNEGIVEKFSRALLYGEDI